MSKNRKTWSHEDASVFEARGCTGQLWQSIPKEYHVFYLNFHHLSEGNLSLMKSRDRCEDGYQFQLYVFRTEIDVAFCKQIPQFNILSTDQHTKNYKEQTRFMISKKIQGKLLIQL